MRCIDVHTHFYPDDIAGQVVRALTKPGEFEASGDGTVRGLREFMKKDGVSLSVNLPVATKKEQVRGINRRMVDFNRTSPGDVICFGTMHPEYRLIGDISEEIGWLAENGIKGIKLHPDYQEFYPDDVKMTAIYEACRDHGIIVHFHAGFDFPFPDHTRGTPERFRQVTAMKGLKVVFAHLGGYRFEEGVLRHLVGTAAYFDTAFSAGIDVQRLREIVTLHGAERILFGSDFPWNRAAAVKEKIEKAISETSIKEKIYWKNAGQLLGIGG